MGARRRPAGPRRELTRSFRPYRMSGDEPCAPRREEWSASELAVDKWISRSGDPSMSRTVAIAQLLAAAQGATCEREKARGGALYYRVQEPRCRLVVKHQASGIRIVTVLPVGGVAELDEVEIDDAA